jgi:tetratricopeptide (TPR) repeat protein
MRRLVRNKSFLLVLFLTLTYYLPGQEPSGSSQEQKPPEPAAQAQPGAAPSATPPAEIPAPQAASQETAETLAPPKNSQTFKFGKVDLDLLKQVNAFDAYMEEKGWVCNDPETNAYLDKLGSSLVPAQTPENVTWRFRAIRDLEVNAFALPNGSIYVNSGLLSRMENEAQVAGVLAHEITHVVNRHSYLEYRSYRKKMVAIDVMAAVGTYGGGIAGAMSSLLSVIVVSTIFGYSRELEHEADVYAVNTLNVQGYDLQEFARGFELLRKGPEVDLSKEPVFWASHPKLADRVQYVSTMAARLQPNAASLRTGERPYRTATKNVIRLNAGLALMLGRPRTAAAIAQRLMLEEPNNADNVALLGDAYRTLGARTPVPDDEELTDHAKNEARKLLQKMTMVEYDKALMAQPHGVERWEANAARSEETYRKALAMDPNNATSHRGLGFLYERKDRRADAVEEFKKYLELAPGAKDTRQIKLHIESLEKPPPAAAPVPEHP